MVMRMSGPRDGLLLAGFAVALLTVFDRTIGQLLEIASQVESSYGVRLLPALVVLAAIFVIHLYAKRQESRAEAEAAALTARSAEERLRELERLHSFGRQLAGSLSLDAIQGTLWRYLPAFAEERSAWVTVWERDHAEVLMDSAGGPADRLRERTRSLLDQWHLGDGAEIARREDGECCFVLVAGGSPIGVLGVSEREGPVTGNAERVLAAASALVAVSIRNVQLFQQLRDTAVTDALTGCMNRAHFIEIVGAELRRSRRTGSPMSLVMLDLDEFKQLNDQDGHLAGDTALANVGRRLKEKLRQSDVRCRYGGDEFLVLLPDTPLKGALHVADVLRREIEALGIRPSRAGEPVTASIGVATAIAGEVDPVSFIQRADRALYSAKHDGGNRVSTHDEIEEPAVEGPRLVRPA
jgi:diguanylate cyclase (GGDEF)-like protein